MSANDSAPDAVATEVISAIALLVPSGAYHRQGKE
jgi:hypothetical protein